MRAAPCSGGGAAAALPPLPRSNNQLLPVAKALAFMHGLLCDARKLTHVAYLRRDPGAPDLIGIGACAVSQRQGGLHTGFGVDADFA